MNKNIKINWNLITGLIITLINLYWIWYSLRLLYLYHYSNILFLIMIPDWLLILNSILGLVGIFIGLSIIRQKIMIKKGILIDLLIFLTGISLQIIITSI